MKMPVVIVLCLVFALAGFFGGRMSGSGAPADAQASGKSGGSGSGGSSRGDGEGRGDKEKSATAKGERRTGSGSSGSNSLPQSFREYFEAMKDQDLVLADGEEREVLVEDLTKLSQLTGALSRADKADVAELKEYLMTLEEPLDPEQEMLKTMLLRPLFGREVELRGAAALDEMVEKNQEEEDDIFSEILPLMVYSLAKQNPAEAEAWYTNFMKRPDAEEFSVDTDELKALIEKGKK